MGIKKHSLGTAFGKGQLQGLVEEIDEGDGCRFDGYGGRTHRGLSPKKEREEIFPNLKRMGLDDFDL